MSIRRKRLWLRELRTASNLTQTEMAHIIGTSRSEYNHIECGARGLRGQYDTDYFTAISEYFGIPLTVLHELESRYLRESEI